MAVASPAVTPFINVFVPYMGDPAYWEGSVGAADETAATLYLTCPAEEFCSFNSPFRVVTGSDFIEYTASSSGQYTYVTCDDLDGGASETCSIMYSIASTSDSNAYSIYSDDLFVPLLLSAAYMTNGAELLAINTADTESSLFPFAASATSVSSVFSAFESKSASTRSGSETATKISGTTAATGKASGTGSSANNGGAAAAAGSGSASGARSGSASGSAKPSASGSTSNNAATTKNAAPGQNLGKTVYGLGGLLAALTAAVAAL